MIFNKQRDYDVCSFYFEHYIYNSVNSVTLNI